VTGSHKTASDWRVVSKAVWIEDLDQGGKSVTNDAEAVCRALHEQYPGCKIYYLDTTGRWGELVHVQGVFVGYAGGVEPQGVRPS
jgi:hypothetical protein